jgi:dTDP-D-glucose 4,6-dehydratase
MKTYIVTGGAGFIGSDCVLGIRRVGEARIINLDLLTYAGDPINLESLESDPDYIFVQGDIRDRDLVKGILELHRPVRWSTSQLNPMWIALSMALKTSSRKMLWAPFIH